MDITRKDSNYEDFVNNSDPTHYLIYAGKLECGDTIQCPNDPNMLIKKSMDGKITMVKKGHGPISIKVN